MKRSEDNIEAALIARCRAGDRTAFGELIRPYRTRLMAYLVRYCNDRTLAEDLFQDVLMRVWKYLPGYDHRNRFASWLFGIAHNILIDAGRRKKVREMVTYADTLPEKASTDDPVAQVIAGEMQSLILQVLDTLSENQRRVFLLRQHGDLSFREIAEVMRQPLNTVLGHMHYAVKKMKKALKDHEEL